MPAANAPKFTPEDLKAISSPIDFVGLNVYMPNQYVVAGENGNRFCAVAVRADVSAYGFELAQDRS